MESSPLAAAVAKVGDRWALLIVETLLEGPRRFGELQAALPGIAPNVLSQRLKHLEREGVVVARAYSHKPPRFAYALTGAGEDLAGAIRMLIAWGAAHGEDAAPPAHRLCGTPLDVRWYCPTCDTGVSEPDADELRYA
ncbi:MAG: transcriptional regulator [Nitriliruptorales bacterium]|nr:transcriptional regulator [Nitriliruptorales bacterium]